MTFHLCIFSRSASFWPLTLIKLSYRTLKYLPRPNICHFSREGQRVRNFFASAPSVGSMRKA